MNVLLVEDNPGDVVLFREWLAEWVHPTYDLVSVATVADGLQTLEDQTFEVLLIDLNLPDSFGLDTLIKFTQRVSDIPIIVLTGLDNQALGLEAIRKGAQDYLVKNNCSADVLRRSLEYAIEREKLRNELQQAQIEIRRLKDLLPMCAGCKQFRDKEGAWHPIEAFIVEQETDITHTYCPQCESKLTADIDSALGES